MARVKPSSKPTAVYCVTVSCRSCRGWKKSRNSASRRRSRAKADIPTVSLVGYTNAGKSTLFNQITAAEVYAANQLFATLDPTLRRIDVPDVGETVLADTVGFIRHLPHDLVAAFKATLQETRQATLLLHVIDAADVRVQENIDAVNTVLAEIEADEIPALLVMNKIDMLDDFEPRIDRDDENKPIRVWLSAQTGVGVPLLFQALTERLSGEVAQHTLRLPPKEGRLRSRFYQLQAIEKEWMEDDGSVSLQVRMPIVDWRRLCKQSQRLLTMWFNLAACLKILTPVGISKTNMEHIHGVESAR